jgi:hypothetical protein
VPSDTPSSTPDPVQARGKRSSSRDGTVGSGSRLLLLNPTGVNHFRVKRAQSRV